MLKCGIFEHDITPALGYSMPGYFADRLSTGIKEPLRCSAIVFAEDNGVRSVIVSVDAIQIPAAHYLPARQKIAEKLAVDINAVTIHATHIHSGGPVGDFPVKADKDYCIFLENRIIDSVILASQQLRDVKIGFARDFDNTLAHYRIRALEDGTIRTNYLGEGIKTKPYGEIDPEITCMVIDNADGSHYGVIVNYACHTDCVGGQELSSDFPGAMRETLRETFGQAFMPVFLNGFFGNLNHIDFDNFSHKRSGYYRSMGRKLARRVSAAMEDAVYFDDPILMAASKTITVKTRMPESELLEWAKELLADRENAKIDDIYFAEQALAIQQEGEQDFDLCLQVQRFGGINLFACPREVFVEFEHMLKAQSDSNMNICTCNSNGGYGYVPIKELIRPGVYESRLCRDKLEPEAGYKMVEGLLDLMTTLKPPAVSA